MTGDMTAGLAAYLAYPIDNATLPNAFYTLVELAEELLLDSGVISAVYDPGDAFNVRLDDNPHRVVADVNKLALKASEVVVAFLPAGQQTIGVPIEIDRAVNAGKWVIIATDVQSFSLKEYARNPRVLRCGLTEEGVRQAVERVSTAISVAPPVTRGATDGPEALPVLVGPGGRLPSRGYDDDAGLDLHVVGDHTILPNAWLDVPCKVSVELPPWVWGLITGRSSTLRTKRLLVHSGIIDPGWRGELFAGAMNVGEEDVQIKDGERIAQLILLPNVTREFTPQQVSELQPSARGTNGFGSTGS